MTKKISVALSSYFKLSESKTTVRTEIMEGITTFLTHCLILLFIGKWRKVKPLTVIVALIFVARYAFITLG